MSEGDHQNRQPDGTQPPSQRALESVARGWPVVVVPAVVIVLTAVAGAILRDQTALVVGVVTVAVLAGLVGFHILGRKGPWRVAFWVCVATVPLLGLGLPRWDEVRVPATASSSPAQPPTPPTLVNAGRQFTQQRVNELRHFRGADLRGAQFVHLDLRGIDFSGANAAGASFYGSRLDRAIFRGTDLGGAILIEACLRGAIMPGADLTGAIATDADVSGAEVTSTQLAVAISWPAAGVRSPACS